MYQMLGTDFTQVKGTGDDAEFPLGSVAEDQNGKRYVYCEAGGAIGDKVPIQFADTVTPFDDVVVSGNSGPCDAINATGQAIADGEKFWAQVSGIVEDANVATGLSAGAFIALDSDANGDFQAISATSATDAVHTPRGKCLEAESGGLADVLLYAFL